jgi:hypothetical protein
MERATATWALALPRRRAIRWPLTLAQERGGAGGRPSWSALPVTRPFTTGTLRHHGVIAGEPHAWKLARGFPDRGSLEKDPPSAGTSLAAVAAYRLSVQAGNPLSERRLAQMFGRTSRRWARARIADARQASPLPDSPRTPVTA